MTDEIEAEREADAFVEEWKRRRRETFRGYTAEGVNALRIGFVAGFEKFHASRDAEIAAKEAEIAKAIAAYDASSAEYASWEKKLLAEIADLRAQLAAMREPIWMLREEHEAAMAELRSRLEAAEARAVRWVSNEEAQAMMSDADGGRAYADIDACPQREIVCLAPMIPQPPMMPGDAERADAWRERYVANVMAAPVPLPETEP